MLGRCASHVVRLIGWRVLVVEPVPPRCVVVFYPHTSNWDLALGLLAKWIMDLHFKVLVKDTVPFARWLAPWSIPINRRARTGATAALAARFAAEDELRLVVAPEGTRSRTEHWKSGFYRLALEAKIPLALSFVDYARRETGIGACFVPTGNRDADMRTIAAFYAGKTARYPAQAGPVRLAGKDPC